MDSRVSWDALRVFVAVLRAGSFSAAADELGTAQSSLSEQLARLEKKLGYALLIRGAHGVKPTARGAELAERVGDAVDGLAVAVANTLPQGSGSDAPGTRFLGGPAEFLSEVVLPRITAHLPPGTTLATRFGLPEELITALRAGELDAVVSSVAVREQGLKTAPIADEVFQLVGHPRWAEQAATQLDEIPLLAYAPDLPIVRRYWRSVFERRPDRLRLACEVPDLRSLRTLALSGAGMTVLPEYLIRDDLEQGTLTLLHETAIPPLNTLYVVTREPLPLDRPGANAAIAQLRDAIMTVAKRAE
ncbi:LysR family transcriptional regulator [Leucobacter insecticola]|uniref:LysR family transcriptional regulator n=1 Tax=Leucobacter insecticola TaxID=2714934 RepID=A0A6G8FL57_9MICO|nr:LysR family transcriptional regulator [Leucobacter insecticola]QIM16812.1 LysR family transcriptional regulator [Leucobacter insecticola]